MEQFGVPVVVVDGFVDDSRRRGRGSYTIRSYRLGVGDFSRWLVERQRAAAAVSRRDVEDYITAFAAGDRADGHPSYAAASAVVDVGSRHLRDQPGRAPRTVNHRLSVLASLFDYLIATGQRQADNPVPRAPETGPRHGRPGGGDAPVRVRAELRRREPRKLPRDIDPQLIARLVASAPSWRDRALLVLLSRTGARIGDWSDDHGRHGVLGMSLADFDRRTSTVTVRLKGARDEHQVPVTAEFWAAFDRYLATERGNPPTDAAWVGAGRGRGRPPRYAAFEAALRSLGGRLGVKVSAHMFRHTVATALVQQAGVAVAQQVLGHRHVATTVDTYAHVDGAELVRAIDGLERRAAADRTGNGNGPSGEYVFP
jgi:integrase